MSGGSHDAPFLGRATEVQALAHCLQVVATGRATTVLIEGEAGIGKTRFLHDALAASDRRGLQVLSASGDELEGSRPFGLLCDALGIRVGAQDRECAAIADLLRGEAAQGFEDSSTTIAAGPNLAYRVVEDIVSLMERLASATPVVLALDDLQLSPRPPALGEGRDALRLLSWETLPRPALRPHRTSVRVSADRWRGEGGAGRTPFPLETPNVVEVSRHPRLTAAELKSVAKACAPLYKRAEILLATHRSLGANRGDIRVRPVLSLSVQAVGRPSPLKGNLPPELAAQDPIGDCQRPCGTKLLARHLDSRIDGPCYGQTDSRDDQNDLIGDNNRPPSAKARPSPAVNVRRPGFALGYDQTGGVVHRSWEDQLVALGKVTLDEANVSNIVMTTSALVRCPVSGPSSCRRPRVSGLLLRRVRALRP